ncbi:MAG: hypothetical protein WA040_02865 [Anaerolineae bacterium]
MTSVAIMPVTKSGGEVRFYALAGDKNSHGRTPGAALDALTDQMAEEDLNTLIIVQNFRSDRFFDARQRQRLTELMDSWREARDAGIGLPRSTQAELDALIEAELRASADRTAALLAELRHEPAL